MERTTALYDRDAYRTEFEATVLSSAQAEDGAFRVILDQTCFFPEQGGQTADRGLLWREQDREYAATVIDARIADGVVTHICDRPFLPGDRVKGRISWQRRLDFMRQHTGEHILSGVVCGRFRYHNVGFHLSDHGVTVDYDGPLDEDQLREVERAANEAVLRDLPVIAWYPDKQEIEALSYRSKKELSGAVRLVSIPGVDLCACCVPHVRHTGEVGMIKVLSMIRWKGGVRLSIACGQRALEAFTQKQRVLAGLTDLMTAGEEDLADNVRKLRQELKESKARCREAEGQMLLLRAGEIPAEQQNALLFVSEADEDSVSEAVKALTARHPGISGVLCGDDEQGYRFMLGSPGRDLRPLAAFLRERGVKGGGSSDLIRGFGRLPKAAWETLIKEWNGPDI